MMINLNKQNTKPCHMHHMRWVAGIKVLPHPTSDFRQRPHYATNSQVPAAESFE